MIDLAGDEETLFLLVIGLAVGVPSAMALGRYVSINSTESRLAIHGLRFLQLLCWLSCLLPRA
jgi:hypothetical protein